MNTGYIDKESKPVKVGDILFYNECMPYAESIHVVEEIDGEFCGRTVVGNYDRSYFIAKDDTPTNLIFYTNRHAGQEEKILNDATVIGNVNDSPEMLTVEYANKLFPLTA
jgi:hypothetical protein